MKRLLLTAKLLFSGGLLLYLCWKFPVLEAVAALRGTRSLPLTAAILILLPMVLLAGCQTLYLTRLQGILLSLRAIIRINLATQFYSLFLPGVLAGGAVKWYKFARQGKKPAQAAAVVLFNRFLETFVMVLVGVLFLLPEAGSADLPGLRSAALLLLAGLLSGYGLLLMPSLPAKAARWCDRLPLPGRLQEKCRKLLAALQRFHQFRLQDHLGLHAILLLKNVLGIGSIFCLARALALDLTFLQLGWVRSVVMLLSMLPLSFSGLGVREGTLVVLLSGYGIFPAEALALSFLIFLRSLFPAAAGGLFELQSFLRRTEPEPLVPGSPHNSR